MGGVTDVGLWPFEAGNNAQVKTQENAYAAVRKSARPHRASGSLDLWHRRLGHTSKQVPAKTEEMVDGVEIEASPRSKTIYLLL